MNSSKIILTILLMFASTAALAAVPGLVNIQGVLRDGGGLPVANGSYAVIFTIYDAPVAGGVYWAETTMVATNSGTFTTLLGSVHAVPDAAFADSSRWFGIKVASDPEMSPRQRLASVGFAFRVGSVNGASGGSINGSLSFGNSATPVLYMHESGSLNPTRPILAHSPAFPNYGLGYDDVNERMNFNGLGGNAVLSVGLDSRFVGVNCTDPVTGADYFSISAPVSAGEYGGMYISTPGVDGLPFYGYTTLSHSAWTYLDGPSGEWRLNYGGDKIRVDPAGNVGISTNPTSATRLGIDAPSAPLSRGILAFSGASSGVGVAGYSNDNTGMGIFGNNLVGWAGYFNGMTHCQGDLSVSGTVSKGGGSFKIDHPLDPANKYLSHSFVESPDMKNIYDGVVTTDAKGYATVDLPEWFGALNRDFRYQLTVLGQFAQAIVAREIAGNRFTIQTNLPNVKVSWQVTGIRQDAFANAHRIPVEETKSAKERGSYLYPEVIGQPEEKGVEWALHPDLMKEIKADMLRQAGSQK
jgi:hypothetical protein